MKIIDVRMRAPFGPYLEKGNMFDKEVRHPFALATFYRNFGCRMSASMAGASMDLLLEEMDALGDVTGVVSMRRSAKGFENDALVELLQNYPGRFLGACGLPPEDADAALGILQKYVLDGPCITAFMEPGFAGLLIDDAKIDPIYAFCEQHAIPLLISYGGFHGPTDEYCKPVHAQHVAENYPGLKICLCHACWPWVEPAVMLAYRCPNVWLSPDIYALHVAGGQGYMEAANYMLRDKILYGSAYPCVDLESSVAQYLEKLHANVAENIFYRNAQAFFGLKE